MVGGEGSRELGISDRMEAGAERTRSKQLWSGRWIKPRQGRMPIASGSAAERILAVWRTIWRI